MTTKYDIFKLKMKALVGNSEAMFLLGNNYLYVIGVKPDIELAYNYLKKSAEKGFLPAQESLIYAFTTYNGSIKLSEDLVKIYDAVSKISRDADMGNPEALYLKSENKLQDRSVNEYMFKRGLNDMKIAADKGYAPAQFLLGMVYYNGERVKGLSKEGLDLILKASKQNYKPAIAFFQNMKDSLKSEVNPKTKMAFPKKPFSASTNVIFDNQLTINISPLEIITKQMNVADFPISGGWGYTGDTAVVVHLNNESTGVDFEYWFIKYRANLELNGIECEQPKFAEIQCVDIEQSLRHAGGHSYDVMQFNVQALPISDWEELKADWESHNGYEDDEAGRKAHIERAKAKYIEYRTECHFDITCFFGGY